MPRCAVSIASATPKPTTRDGGDTRCVASQSIAASSHGSFVDKRIGDDVRGGERLAREAACDGLSNCRGSRTA